MVALPYKYKGFGASGVYILQHLSIAKVIVNSSSANIYSLVYGGIWCGATWDIWPFLSVYSYKVLNSMYTGAQKMSFLS